MMFTSKLKMIWGVVLVSSSLLLAAGCGKRAETANALNDPEANAPAANAPGSVYAVTMAFQNQNGQQVSWQSLKGKVRVMAMVFTHCEASCPRITQDMKDVERLIPESARQDVNFTLVSFDSKRDTPARLKAYSAERGLDATWQLLHGADDDVQMVANLLDVKYKALPNGSFDHENVIVVIDRTGKIVFRGVGIAQGTKEIADKVASLVSLNYPASERVRTNTPKLEL